MADIFGELDSRVGPENHGKGEAHPKLNNGNVFGEKDSRVDPSQKLPSTPQGEKLSNFK